MINRMSDLFLLHRQGFACHTEREFQTGGFIMRIYLMPVLFAFILTAGCDAGPARRAVVEGAGAEELLNLRAGPGLGYRVNLGLPDGTVVLRHDCVTELGQLWCRVSLAAAPGLTGYVSADYLSEQ